MLGQVSPRELENVQYQGTANLGLGPGIPSPRGVASLYLDYQRIGFDVSRYHASSESYAVSKEQG